MLKDKNIFSYEEYLDAFRALAIILVFLFHINKDLFFFGYVGVDIFFVISGYVITQSITKHKFEKSYFSIINFYSKRVLRLFPALFFMILFFLSFYLLLLSWSDFQLEMLVKSSLYSLFGISNFYFFSNLDQFNYFLIDDHSVPLIHTWSLSIEGQFYIFYPLIIVIIIYFFRKDKKIFPILFLFLITIFILSFYYFLGDHKYSHFYLPFSRVWELVLGCILFLVLNDYTKKLISKKKISILIISLLISFFFHYKNNTVNLEKILIIFSVGIFSIIILFNSKIPKYFYQSFVIKFIGRSSYSIYLWHMPIIYLANLYFKKALYFYSSSIILTIIFSTISYKYIEKIRYNKLLIKTLPNLLKIVSILIFLSFFLTFNNQIKIRNIIHNTIVKIDKIFYKYNFNKDNLQNRLKAKWELSVDNCKNNDENFKRNTYLNCIKENNIKNDFFLILGDSYGEHFINVLAHNNSIKNLYYSRLDNENFLENSNYFTYEYTLKNYKKLLQKFNQNRHIIISLSYPNTIDPIKLKNFIEEFEINDKIIFVNPHKFKQDTKKCNPNKIDYIVCKINLDNSKNQNIIFTIENLKKIRKNIFIYNFQEKFCNINTCRNYLENKDLYVFVDDFNHITKEFAEYIADDFQYFIKNIKF